MGVCYTLFKLKTKFFDEFDKWLQDMVESSLLIGFHTGFFVVWKVTLLLQWCSDEVKTKFSIGVYQNHIKRRKLATNWLLGLHN